MRKLLSLVLVSLCLQGQNAVGGKYSRGGVASLGGGATPATPTLIQSWCQALGNTGGTTNPQSIVGANFVVGSVGHVGSYGISDSKGNTVTQLTNSSAGGPDLQNFYIQNPTTDASYTITLTGGPFAGLSVCYQAWSGMAITGVFDSGTDQVGGTVSSTCQTPNITPSSGVKMVFNANSNEDTMAMSSINLSYTIPTNGQVGYGVATGLAMAYLIQTPNGAATQPTWTGTTITNCAIAAFKGM